MPPTHDSSTEYKNIYRNTNQRDTVLRRQYHYDPPNGNPKLFRGIGKVSRILIQDSEGITDFLSATLHLLPLYKSQILPPLENFDGKGNKLFKTFLKQFHNKYPPSVFAEDESKDIFVTHLTGKAWKCYKSLDTRIQEGSLNLIIQQLKILLQKDEQVESLKAATLLEQLKMEQNRTIEYCDKLENFSKQAFPSLGAVKLSFYRATHHYKQISHLKGAKALEALRVMERNDRTSVYSDLKSLVFEWDRTRINDKRLNTEGDGQQTWKQNNFSQDNRNSSYQRNQRGQGDNNYGNAWNNTKQHIICHNCSQPGHYAN